MMLSLFVGVITTSMGQAAVKQHKAMTTQMQIKKLQVRSPLLWKRLGSWKQTLHRFGLRSC